MQIIEIGCLPISPTQGFAAGQTNLSAGEPVAAIPPPGGKKHLSICVNSSGKYDLAGSELKFGPIYDLEVINFFSPN